MNQLQKAIKDLISQHGSLRAAARATGIDPAYLCRMKKKQHSNPSSKTLARLGISKQTRYVKGNHK